LARYRRHYHVGILDLEHSGCPRADIPLSTSSSEMAKHGTVGTASDGAGRLAEKRFAEGNMGDHRRRQKIVERSAPYLIQSHSGSFVDTANCDSLAPTSRLTRWAVESRIQIAQDYSVERRFLCISYFLSNASFV